MNLMVDKWNRSQRRPRYDGPDAVGIDGETRVLGSGNVQERKIKMTNVTITMNRRAVVDLALYGQEDRVEGLARRTNEALRRLKIPFGAGRRFRRPPNDPEEVTVPHPGLHDVQRWLDSVKRVRRYKDEMAFVSNLYVTCRGRVRPEVLKELES